MIEPLYPQEELKNQLYSIDVKQFSRPDPTKKVNLNDKRIQNYNIWNGINMAFAMAGGSYDDWIEWCKGDPEEFERLTNPEAKWKSFFKGNSPEYEAGKLERFAIKYGNYAPEPKPMNLTPERMLLMQIRALFEPEDYLKIITNGMDSGNTGKSGKYRPVQTFIPIQCEELIQKLENGRTLKQIFPGLRDEVGAWIGVNPINPDGEEIGKDSAVTKFQYVLIEFDTDQNGEPIPLKEQMKFFLHSKLPIATLTYSGGKSLHALVKIDAEDRNDYQKKVKRLFDWLTNQGFDIDQNNKNPGRLSRLAGVMRYDKQQYLIKTNFGMSSFSEWYKRNTKPAFYSEDADGKVTFQRDWMGDWIRETESIKRLNGEICIYDETKGLYVPDEKLEFLEQITREYMPNITRSMVKEVRDYIKSFYLSVNGDTHPIGDSRYLNFKNGVIDLQTFEFRKRKRSMNLTSVIPHNYNGDPDPELIQYCTEVVNEWANNRKDLRTLIFEIIGSCMESRLEPFQKAFILYGIRNTGKSKFVELLEHILGESNYSALELAQINRRFDTIHLKDKKANMRNDISEISIKDASILKQAITGDSLMGERKGIDGVKFKPFATMVFSCNSIPAIKDDGQSIKKRIQYVPFDHTFIQGGNPDFEKRIFSEPVLETFIFIGIQCLKDAIERNHFTVPECSEQLEDQFLIESNPVFEFWGDHMGTPRAMWAGLIKANRTDKISKDVKQFYEDDYHQFCLEKSYQKLNWKEFKNQTQNYFGVHIEQRKRSVKEQSEIGKRYGTYAYEPTKIIQ